jgi:hypothetical protein
MATLLMANRSPAACRKLRLQEIVPPASVPKALEQSAGVLGDEMQVHPQPAFQEPE